jgi:hypothetical protein
MALSTVRKRERGQRAATAVKALGIRQMVDLRSSEERVLALIRRAYLN